ncbi:rhomboid family intramembrane serine protease [Mesobacillus maritimus]|jgi:rhomboid protease GluP|uniref:Rhomboid family intramembrane serine protease n=1 Tax=Mesobacillus maritimus TaxID=1643336 RepID=A0ABS7KBA1_9BACI|nr:rhomboid family intramembrane serine protease [Mesobacillus maritimus]MBY0099553.1 rhomboid family intramembrane serine protease [Mesobacillus maritimus]
MFVRTESFREFIRFYPLITLILIIHLLVHLATTLPLLPSREIFTLLAGVNLYIIEGEFWRILTPIFVHSGFAHLLFNSFSLVLFGPALERILGKAKFLLVYLLTGIAANVATLLLEPPTYTHVGSSGAIFGLFGFYLAISMFRKDLLSKENSQIIITIAVIGVIMTFFQSNINITAHIFGLIAGFFTGRVLLLKQ